MAGVVAVVVAVLGIGFVSVGSRTVAVAAIASGPRASVVPQAPPMRGFVFPGARDHWAILGRGAAVVGFLLLLAGLAAAVAAFVYWSPWSPWSPWKRDRVTH